MSILPKYDPELAGVVRQKSSKDGFCVLETVLIERVEVLDEGVRVVVVEEGSERAIDGSHLLIATGRRPNIEGLNPEKAGIVYSENGIQVDSRMRTSNKKVFAIGDVVGGLQFTHVAGYQAGVVIKNALFRIPAKAEYSTVPRVTYTRPELAQVGISESAAEKNGVAYRVLRWPFNENDRAQTEKKTEGLIKAIVTPRGHILGCGIVGAHAGELIQPWVLAMKNKLKISAIAEMVVPYPTFSEVSKRTAISFFTPTLFNNRTRKIVKILSKFG